MEANRNPDWYNWRWQMQNRIHDLDTLEQYFHPTPDEMEAIAGTDGIFRWNITPYYASLIDPKDPECVIRKQVVPRKYELEPDIVGVVDPLEEVAHSPVKNLVHNYKDRVAFCVTAECAIYCRYCLRKRMVGDAEQFMNRTELGEAIAYIARTPAIRDVLLTGGDPLIFNEKNLGWLLEQLRAIPHVQVLRIGTRLPVTLPYRITDALCELLEAHHPVWLNTHFNHPKELTPAAIEACERLVQHGVPVGNQTVLLKGVNDDPETLRRLNEGLVRMRVRPYYLYQAQLIGGTAPLRTSIERGMAIMKALQGTTSGFALPVYLLDTPLGKVPLNRTYVKGRAGDHVIMETHSGELWAEPNPLRGEETFGFTLPAMEMPADIKTVPTGAPRFVPIPGGVGTI